ncbi:MAG: TonB-dependent receptor plug domain-containing protein [Pseudomonadota bacterium]
MKSNIRIHKMFNRHQYHSRSCLYSAVAISALIAPNSFASASQVGQPIQITENQPTGAEETEERDEIVVTGSRIRRDSFSSPTPLQVLDIDQAQQIGIPTIANLLQQSTVANGAQIDATLNTAGGSLGLLQEAPPPGGAGSANIDLRGLGPERTLLLVNGRRLGGASSRGAPTQPDINLLPTAMVERIEVITEGASAIYGADAVAGVVNVILKDEFDGLEITGMHLQPEEDGGASTQISLVAGSVSDRSRITFGAEYFNRERLSLFQRDWTDEIESIFLTEDGQEIRQPAGNLDNTIFVADPLTDDMGNVSNWLLYTPGQTNVGIPNYTSPAGLPDGNGLCVNGGGTFGSSNCFSEFRSVDEVLIGDLVQPIERLSLVANGSYDLTNNGDTRLYFEAYYSSRNQKIIAPPEQIFPDIPGTIPILDSDGNQVG